MRTKRPVDRSIVQGCWLVLLAVGLAVGCTAEGGGPAAPCTQLLCEGGSSLCCEPPYPGVWDPAGQSCACPPPPDTDATTDVGADADADQEVGPDADADAPPLDSGPDGTLEPRGAYPSGPYGVVVGSVMRNYSFLTRVGHITLQDVRVSREHSVLLIYLGSPECSHCSVETPELNALYTTYEPRGLEILGVIADVDTGPPTGVGADRYFVDTYGAEYPHGANAWSGVSLMGDLFPDGNVATPENFVLDLDTMRILERLDGYPDTGGLAPYITPYL